LSILRLSFLLLLVCCPLLPEVAQAQENVDAKGILARGDRVILFTRVRRCAEESQIPSAQIFVSTDAGRSWSKRGPQLKGNDFEYVYERGGRIWIAGLHTAEFGADPFILVPTDWGIDWHRYNIYEGPGDLERIAFLARSHLTARVRHINVRDENWKEYIHESVDGGRSWKLVGLVGKVRGASGLAFERIRKRAPKWRIVESGDGGFVVQHRRGLRAPWRTVSRFPWKRCLGDR
jgi:hypothetical protein